MRLLQLVPQLPPTVGGVGEYAVLLSKELRKLGVDTQFLLPDPHASAAKVPGCPATFDISLCTRRAGALAQALDAGRPDAVLVHYSGYGYARRGAPVWLARGLRRWKARASGPRLVVMFHELWASGPPWRSSFWMSPLQRKVVRDLICLADSLLTNTELHAARLASTALARPPVVVSPVVSNIGEIEDVPPLSVREPAAAVFGQRGMRERVYAFIDDFLRVLSLAGIERIYDIGPPLDHQSIARCPVPVTGLGYLEAAAASDVMRRCRLGLLDYPLDLAAKSGILAAYAAHGLIPVIRSETDGVHDGLRPGVNVFRTVDPPPDFGHGAAERIAAAAHLWYQEHDLARAASCFAEALHSIKYA